MKIIKKSDDVRNIQDVNEREVFTLNGGTYIVSKVLWQSRVVMAFNLEYAVIVDYDFDTQVLYKPNACICLEGIGW